MEAGVGLQPRITREGAAAVVRAGRGRICCRREVLAKANVQLEVRKRATGKSLIDNVIVPNEI
jgi:hypothetical protein